MLKDLLPEISNYRLAHLLQQKGIYVVGHTLEEKNDNDNNRE